MQVAEPFNLDELQRQYPTTYKESMNTVLQQEAMRYNALLTVVAASLKECAKAVQGLVVMSPSLEAVCNSMFDNQAGPHTTRLSRASIFVTSPIGSWTLAEVYQLNGPSSMCSLLCIAWLTTLQH